MNATATLWFGFVIGLPSTPFGWLVRTLALIFGIRLAWALFAREKISVTARQSKNPNSAGQFAWRIVQFLLAVSLLLVAMGVLK